MYSLLSKVLFAVLFTGFSCVVTLKPAQAVLVAEDNYETASGVAFGSASGSGFGAHTQFSGSGGIFHTTTSGLIDGNGSLGSFSGGSSTSWGRSILDTSAFSGSNTTAIFDLSMRFNIPNSTSSLKGVNVKGGGLGSGFGDNELISVGMLSGAGNQSLFITGSSTQSLFLPDTGNADIRGDIIDVTIQWNTDSGDFTLTAGVRGEATASTTGVLKNPSGTFIPDALGFIHSGIGGGGNDVFFDNLSVAAVPEPSAFLFGGLICGLLVANKLRKGSAKLVSD